MNAIERLPIVGVMGSGSERHESLAAPLGEWLAGQGVHLLTGGGGGVMASVSEAFARVPERAGRVIGVLPGPEARQGYPNTWIEIAIRTHLPLSGARGTELGSRNHINVLTPDVVVALPGGAGTLSEVRLAQSYGTPTGAYLSERSQFAELPPNISVLTCLGDVQSFVLSALGR